MKSALIKSHLHCPLFRSLRLQTYPGTIFKETKKKKKAHKSRPLINSILWHAGLRSEATVERAGLLVGGNQTGSVSGTRGDAVAVGGRMNKQ